MNITAYFFDIVIQNISRIQDCRYLYAGPKIERVILFWINKKINSTEIKSKKKNEKWQFNRNTLLLNLSGIYSVQVGVIEVL